LGTKFWRVRGREENSECITRGVWGWVSESRSVVRARREATAGWSEQDQETSEVIRLTERIWAFCGGGAVGSEAFVEEVFNERRDLFGEKRKRGARRVVAGGKGVLRKALCALRDLRGK